MGDSVLIARIRWPCGRSDDVMLWPGYGFVAPSLVTTNGNAWTLFSAMRAWRSPTMEPDAWWEPVHPSAPQPGATVAETLRALARIAGRPSPDIAEADAFARTRRLDGAVLAGMVPRG